MDIAVDTMVDTTDIPTGHTDTTERGLLTLSQQLNQMLKLMLMLGTDITDMVLDMDIAVDMDMVDTTDIPTGHTDTTERGLLMLSPTMATTDLATTDLATGATATATATDSSTARGRLRPSPRLRLSPTTTVDTDSATTDLDTGATATATATDLSTERGRLRPRLTLTTTVDTDTAMDLATAMVATVLATGPSGDKLLQSLQDLNHRRKTLTLFV